MFTLISISTICYVVYLYNYDITKFNYFVNLIPNFSNNANIDKNQVKEKVASRNKEKKDIESGLSTDYDFGDSSPINNTNEYYDDSLSTDFVEILPINTRFYSFTNSNKKIGKKSTV